MIFFWTICLIKKDLEKKYPFWKEVSCVKPWHNKDTFFVWNWNVSGENVDLEIGSHWIQEKIKKYIFIQEKSIFFWNKSFPFLFLKNKLWKKRIQNKNFEK